MNGPERDPGFFDRVCQTGVLDNFTGILSLSFDRPHVVTAEVLPAAIDRLHLQRELVEVRIDLGQSGNLDLPHGRTEETRGLRGYRQSCLPDDLDTAFAVVTAFTQRVENLVAILEGWKCRVRAD